MLVLPVLLVIRNDGVALGAMWALRNRSVTCDPKEPFGT
jgi:hypothetical protein